MKCRQCGGKVERNLSFCPTCGAPTGKQISNKTIILTAILALAVTAIAIFCGKKLIEKNKIEEKNRGQRQEYIVENKENISVRAEEVPVSGNLYKGVITAKLEKHEIWAYTTNAVENTELGVISEVYTDDDTVYFGCADGFFALDKTTGNTKWKLSDYVGGLTDLVFDEAGNIYACFYNQPDLLVASKDGEVLYEYSDDEFYWAYKIQIKGERVSVFYDGPSADSQRQFKTEDLTE